MYQLHIVDEEHEGGRLDLHLAGVVDAQQLAGLAGRTVLDGRVLHQLVEGRGGDARAALGLHMARQRDHLLHPLLGQRGDEEHRHVVDELQAGLQAAGVLVHGVGVFFHQVPLVDHQDDAFPLVQRIARHVGVLRGQALGRVDHQRHHVGALHRAQGAHHAVLLDPLLDAAAPADAGRVDQHHRLPLPAQAHVDGIACGAGDLADDGAFLAQQRVEQGGLAHVGPADDRDLERVVLFLLLAGGEIAHDLVQQVAHAQAMQRRDGHGLAQTQLVELDRAQLARQVVGLVGGQHHRLLAAAQHVGHILVAAGDAFLYIDQKDHHVGLVDGDLRLLADLAAEAGGADAQRLSAAPGLRAGGIPLHQLDAAGVHQGEGRARPVGIGIEPVAGSAGQIFDDGDALAGDAVEEG